MRKPKPAVILSERGPKRFLEFGGGESKNLRLFFDELQLTTLVNFSQETRNLPG